MVTKYVKTFTTALNNDGGRRIATLLWGDPVHILETSSSHARVQARARGGWVAMADLSDRSLLEIYIIDVGQGDGVLLKTPDEKWHLIDAGVANRSQMTKKGAANFLRWKFLQDLCRDKVSLATVIVTHPDYDHYGGLLDVFSGKLFDGRTFEIEVENLYHNGLGSFKDKPKLGESTRGQVSPFPNGDHGIRQGGSFITQLLDGKDTFEHPPREFADTFAKYATLVSRIPRTVRRLSHRDQHLPGYAPGANDVTIRVLGPILEQLETGSIGLRMLGSEGMTRNGHSIVLRLDYGQARILLTGDLNEKSQKLLLSYHPAAEFAVDVAKGCHHGSEDVDLDFVKAMQARATVVSSGDNEDFAHPRPVILGASARYGREARGLQGELLPPLLYSTELARSVKLAYAAAVQVVLSQEPGSLPQAVECATTSIKAREVRAYYRPLPFIPLSTDLIYGLVNIRTDGVHILCATKEEKGYNFDVKIFKAGVDV